MSVSPLMFQDQNQFWFNYNNPYNTVPFQVSQPQFNPMVEQPMPSQEPSLVSQISNGALFMGAIQGRHIIAHPFRSYSALGKTAKTFKELQTFDAFKAMSNIQKGEAFANLYKVNQLGYKTIKPGLRSVEETKLLGSAYAKARKSYIAALKTGNTAQIQAEAAKLQTFFDMGKKGKKAAADVISAATKSGSSAATTAVAVTNGAKAATTASRTAKAIAWGKDAFKTQGGVAFVAIEGAIELFSEVIPAFSDGGFGAGLVQTAKSAAKVAGSVGGWCCGAKAGLAAGAAIGTAICPGVGTAIGSALGTIIGGISGSWVGTKIAKFISGKSHSEKKQEMAQQYQSQPQPQFQSPFQPQMPQQMGGWNGSFGANPFGYSSEAIVPDYYDLVAGGFIR